jgi:hypothetical protein
MFLILDGNVLKQEETKNKFFVLIFPKKSGFGVIQLVELDQDSLSGNFFKFNSFAQKVEMYLYALETNNYRLQYFMLANHKIHLSKKIY